MVYTNTIEKKHLDDVNIIRPIVIVLLVLMHSFTMYAHAWPLPEGIHDVRAYYWVQKVSFSFMLEMFVFVSGYVFAFQIYERGKVFILKSLVRNKFRRLLLPSIIFSIFYILLFIRPLSIKKIYFVLAGAGHLWFLPMLFCCFIITFLLLKLKINNRLKLICLFGLSSVSFAVPDIFRLSKTAYFLFFFFFSVHIYKERDYYIRKFCNIRTIMIMLFLFILVFIFGTILKDGNYIHGIIHKLINLCIATLGLLLMWFFVNYFIEIKKRKIPQWVVNINSTCFGVYIIHQFFLKTLFYHIPGYPALLGSYWLPVVTFIITLLFSYLLTKLLLRFDVIRKLI
jgi:peptidoglycan/LPS O-acetylase OafA/YrhL